jgi:hypothetical protein
MNLKKTTTEKPILDKMFLLCYTFFYRINIYVI